MPPSRHILSFAEYAAIRHSTPYVVDVRSGGRLLLFGARRTSDPTDPMFDQIEAAFSEVSPTFALHEGTPPAVEADRETAIRRRGETFRSPKKRDFCGARSPGAMPWRSSNRYAQRKIG